MIILFNKKSFLPPNKKLTHKKSTLPSESHYENTRMEMYTKCFNYIFCNA